MCHPDSIYDLGWGLRATSTAWWRVGALDHKMASWGLETQCSHVSSQLCLYDGSPLKALDTKVWVSFPGWEYSLLLHQGLKSNAALILWGDNNWKLCNVLPSWTLTYVLPLPILINLYPLAVIKCNHEYNRFQWVLWIHLVNYWTWGWCWRPLNLHLQLVLRRKFFVGIVFFNFCTR